MREKNSEAQVAPVKLVFNVCISASSGLRFASVELSVSDNVTDVVIVPDHLEQFTVSS